MIRKAKHHIIVIVNIVNTETDSSNRKHMFESPCYAIRTRTSSNSNNFSDSYPDIKAVISKLGGVQGSSGLRA